LPQRLADGLAHHTRVRHEVARKPMIPGHHGGKMAELLWDSGVAALGLRQSDRRGLSFESETDNLHHRLMVNLRHAAGQVVRPRCTGAAAMTSAGTSSFSPRAAQFAGRKRFACQCFGHPVTQ